MFVTFAPITMKLDLKEELTDQLNINEVFSFNIGKVHFTVDECTV